MLLIIKLQLQSWLKAILWGRLIDYNYYLIFYCNRIAK